MTELLSAMRLAHQNLRTSLPRRWDHVRGVARRAKSVSWIFDPIDSDVLISAALLHDIGYAPNLALTGFHPLDGARYLRDRGFSYRLCALVAHHSCAYKEAELRGLGIQLSEWVDEESPLRDALWWADMTTTPDGDITSVQARISEIQHRYGPDDLVTFFIRQAKVELVAAVERTEGQMEMLRRD